MLLTGVLCQVGLFPWDNMIFFLIHIFLILLLLWWYYVGKIQTIYPWSTTDVPATEPPEIWFHDLLNADGSAFNASEIAYIRSLTLPAQESSLNEM